MAGSAAPCRRAGGCCAGSGWALCCRSGQAACTGTMGHAGEAKPLRTGQLGQVQLGRGLEAAAGDLPSGRRRGRRVSLQAWSAARLRADGSSSTGHGSANAPPP